MLSEFGESLVVDWGWSDDSAGEDDPWTCMMKQPTQSNAMSIVVAANSGCTWLGCNCCTGEDSGSAPRIAYDMRPKIPDYGTLRIQSGFE